MQPLSTEALADWLAALIAIPSVSGDEAAVLDYLQKAFTSLAPEVWRELFPAGIEKHPEHIADVAVARAGRRENLFVRWPGDGTSGRRLVVQTHVDTVPWEGWPAALMAVREGDDVIGRGACDCKGHVATLYQLAHALGGKDFAPSFELEFQLVSEEEIGGNGALAAILSRPRADGVVVLESTGLTLYAANRGALWFQFAVDGEPMHMGRRHEGHSAIEAACVFIAQLQDYEQRLIAESRGVPLFEAYEHPVQVNVGTIQGGEWPSMVPAQCCVEGGVGFLPNKNREQIKQELQILLERAPDPWLRAHGQLRYERLRNEAFSTPLDATVVQAMTAALQSHGLDGTPCGWNVSCDARLYATVGQMPAVVFGAGDIGYAHACGERISMQELQQAVDVLQTLIRTWPQA